MQLVEVMVAVAVFTAASSSSMQLLAQAAGRSQQAELRQQRIERIELDRLQLQAHWRRALEGVEACAIRAEQLRDLAASVAVPPQLQRELVPAEAPDELWLRWRLSGEAAVVRERLVTKAGLGNYCAGPLPRTESQRESVS